MINHYDIAYGLGVGLSSPFWLAYPKARRKVLGAFSQRMGSVPSRDLTKPAIMIHAVSVGEINATRALVDVLRRERPGVEFIISVTTQTGFDRAKALYGSTSDVTLTRYPLDFTPAVDRLLGTLKPSVVVLLELEVWPNFIRRCSQKKIPVLLINGRVTPGSFRGYRLARPVVGSMFARLQHAAVQDETYAERFEKLGVPQKRISITGTMKFDTAVVADHLPGQDELAQAMGLESGKPVWVCGSTGPGEEAIILPIYRNLLKRIPDLRLVIVPRHPPRFDEVAELITSQHFAVVRRSKNDPPNAQAVLLGDTMGELAKFYALASVVFVGRSLVDLGHKQHGSDMIEPAALGKATIVGPYTANFAEAMNCFLKAGAMEVVKTVDDLERVTELLVLNRKSAQEIGERAREVVRSQQGATARHAKLILDTLDSVSTIGPR
jgi:3-deoxy-D-manno-octulosonic-acid transferase